MNNMTLPLPNPRDWISVRGAANLLNVSTRTVRRMMDTRVLTPYRPLGSLGENPPIMLWRAEVNAVLNAQLLMRAKTDARA